MDKREISMLRSIYKLSSFVAANITLIVLLVTGVALLLPESFMWIGTASITPMLGIVMFGMGLTLKPGDFKPVLMRPKDIMIGEFAQFIVMPLLAWILCRILQLPAELALGVILVGCCPGGTASNVICYLANGDIALSVSMTGVSTLLAPLVTPALVYILAGEEVNVDVIGMFLSIVEVVIIPILLGFIVNRYLGRFTEKVTPLLPLISTIAIAVIIGIVVSHNSANILSCSLLVGVAVILHNILGLVLGYMAGRMMGLPHSKRTAIAIEVGMQNSGLATSLAATHFAMYPLAAVPGAIFSAWHNFSGSIAASILRKNNKG